MTMAYCNPVDMDFLDSVSMDQHDIQSEMEKILSNSDFLNSENSNQANSAFDFDSTGPNSIDDWIQNIQWNDVAKIQNVMDSSFEIENNNPNLIVNPQTVMPVTMVPSRQSSTQKISKISIKSESGSTPSNLKASVYGSETPGLKIESVVSLNPEYLERNNNRVQIAPKSVSTAAQNSPVIVEHLQNRQTFTQPVTVSNSQTTSYMSQEKTFPKPVYSYSCLIAMALKNSRNGSLPVSEIYSFMTEHFPYFKTAPDGWKNSVRHNLSLNKCFEKVDTPKLNGNTKKGCLWALNPAKIEKMEDEIAKHRKKDLEAIRKSMSDPENLELIEAGKAGPVGPANEQLSPEPQTPTTKSITVDKSNFLSREVTVLDNGVALEQAMPELNFQSSGIWDEIDQFTTPSTTQLVTISASPISAITSGNGNIYQEIFTCASPMISQNSTVTQSSQTPSYIITARI